MSKVLQVKATRQVLNWRQYYEHKVLHVKAKRQVLHGRQHYQHKVLHAKAVLQTHKVSWCTPYREQQSYHITVQSHRSLQVHCYITHMRKHACMLTHVVDRQECPSTLWNGLGHYYL